MSLLQKKTISEKNLALELAVLISIADNNLDYGKNNGTKLYFDSYLDINKINILNLYSKELEISKDNLDKILKSYDNNLSQSIIKSVDSIFSKYKGDTSIQRKTLNLIDELGLSITSMTPAAINKCMSYIPTIKEKILCITLKDIIEKNKLSNKDKKSFLFDLIYLSLLFKNHESIIFILISFCNLLSIDTEYINEFKELAKEYSITRNKLTLICEDINELIEE